MELLMRSLLGLALISTAAVASSKLNLNALSTFLYFVEPLGKIDKNNYKEDVVKIFTGHIKEETKQACSLVISNGYNSREKFRTILFAIIPLDSPENPDSKILNELVASNKKFSESALSYIDFSVHSDGTPKEIIENANYEVIAMDADTIRVQMKTKEFQILSDGGQLERDQNIEIYFQDSKPVEASFETMNVGTKERGGFTCIFESFSI